MAEMVDAFDWSRHAFGTPDTWSRGLHTALQFLLDAAFPAAMWLGPELRLFYNDAYVPILGPRHPEAFGKPGREVWGELWDVIGPQFTEVMQTRRGISIANQMLLMTRHGYEEETYWDYTFSPLADNQGRIAGILNEGHDVTASELRRRHDQLIIELDERLMRAETTADTIDSALELVGRALGAQRTGYGEIVGAPPMLEIQRSWSSQGMPDIRGRYPLGTFGRLTDELAAGRTAVIADNLADPRTNDSETIARYERIGLRSGIVVPVLDRGEYMGGVFVQSDAPRRWEAHQVALAEAASRRLWQALARLRTETALRESEQRFRLIFEQANDIIFTADIDQKLTAANPAGARLLGYQPEELVGKSIADFVSPKDFEQTTAMLRQKLEHGGHTRHEVGVTARDGRQMRWENDSTLVVDPNGQAIGLLSISRDVTERRAFDERRELLIKELNHRVKNTLSLVQGIAHQSFRGGADAGDAPANFFGRLSALSAAHDLLTRDQWEGATIDELVRGATAHAGELIVASGPNLLVTPKSAVALVMAFHELTTNAVKYGALSQPHGRVRVDWNTDDGERFQLTWQEEGGPKVSTPTQRGFGVRMIERALASDLGGTAVIEFATNGIICRIDAPVRGK